MTESDRETLARTRARWYPQGASGPPDQAQVCLDVGWLLALAGDLDARAARAEVEVAHLRDMIGLLAGRIVAQSEAQSKRAEQKKETTP